MFDYLGIALMASMATAVPQPTSIRLNLVAVVPVTCSSAVMLASQPTANGLRINLGGSCNANHLVRVTLPEALASDATAQMNGATGIKESRSFVFQRPGYFADSSVLDINLNRDDSDQVEQPTHLVFEISPV